MRPQKFRYYFISLVFLILISFPIINQNFHLIQDTKNYENKAPLSKPKMMKHDLDSFPSLYEPYYNSNFTIRQRLVKDYYDFHIGIFRKSPHPEQVFIGKNNWLFLGCEENDSYKGINPLTEEELLKIKNELEYRNQYLTQKGIRFYFVIAPIKASIYPEYVPESVIRKSNKTWAHQVIDYLQKNSSIQVIDLHPTLLNAKKGGNVYFKNDNHWNYRAALFSTNTILKRIGKDFPQVTEIPLSDYKEIIKKDNLSGNLIYMLAQTESYMDTFYEYQPYNGFKAIDLPKKGYPVIVDFPYKNEYELQKGIPHSSLPKLLIFSDSFSKYMFPFIAERFSKTTKIFDCWLYHRNESIIENEKPDIVILIMWEPSLRHLLWNMDDKN